MMKPKVSCLLHSHAEPYKSASLLVETRLRKEYRLQSQDLQVKCNYFAGSWINALNPGAKHQESADNLFLWKLLLS